MNRSTLCAVLILISISTLMLAPNATWGNAFVLSLERNFASSDSPPAGPKVVLHQNFDNETIGVRPGNWSLKWSLNQTFGTLLVEKTDRGRSAKFVDNSTNSSPGAYRNFAEQKGTIIVSFAVRLVNNTGKNTGLEIRVDDGTSAGANIIFGNGTIQYLNQNGQLITLRCSYVANRWYRIKFIIDIVANVYNIHIDDHLEVMNTEFTGPCDQVHRIVINETSTSGGAMLPIGDIDDVEVRKGVVIPTDFPTIQEGVDAADPGDTVFVKKGIYFENLRIAKNVCLVGEDRNATVIDGGFTEAEGRKSNVISVTCSDVTIYGFTIKNAKTNGVFVDCLNNTIANNIIIFSLGCGIYLIGSNSTVTHNIIESNADCGIRIVAGKDNLVRRNIIENNGVGLRCDEQTKDNVIYQNRFVCNSRQALDYGSNTWDDGYPYKPNEEKGGGNYWSDFLCADMYSGVNQDEHGPSCSPLPDGICDAPHGADRYPLFLIQNVTQKPAPSEVTYETDVKVNATMLEDVEIEEAKIYVYFDSKGQAITIKKISDDVWNGTIRRKPYGTQVRYNVSARAYCAVWLNSTNYPLTAPYRVGDTKPPTVGTPTVSPSSPNENQTISISVTVTEPANASGVDKVFLSYNASGTLWKTEMIRKGTTDQYAAVMPKQPTDKPLIFVIEAFDKAGNKAPSKTGSTAIKHLAELSLEYQTDTTTQKCDDPCNIDFGVMSKDETGTNKNYKIWDRGNETLKWQIVVVKPNPWFTITPMNGTTGPNKSTSITITVNTMDSSDPWPAVGEFSIKANGTKSEWTIITRVTVRYLIVDDSWASSEAPNRCDVGSTQHYAVHAIWAHNSSDATSGTITVKGIAGAIKINGTGWANFAYSSNQSIEMIFSVEKVNFTYVYAGKVYYITKFTQKAHSPTTIWDRVKIILSIADDRIDVGSKANISCSASVYEFDNSSFEGYPLFNDTLSHNTVGKWYITTSSIVDSKYHLTAFKSNTVWCIWDEIEIIGGGVSQSQLDAGQTGTVWFTAIYRYDNKLFKGADGTLYANNEPLIWSSDREVWARNYTSATQGTKTFTVTGAEDTTHKLTEIKDNVKLLSITWGPKPWWPSWLTTNSETTNSDLAVQNQTFPVASFPWLALTIILAAAIGMVAIILMLVKSGKKRSQGGKGK